MESTQHKIYEIEEQESKHQINKGFPETNQSSMLPNDADIFENRSDYGDKTELSKPEPHTQQTTAVDGTVAEPHIQVKTGTNVVLMKNPPNFIQHLGDYEPLYPPQEYILEESLRREAERVAHQEDLMNRVIFDSIDASPYTNSHSTSAPVEGEVSQFYIPKSEDDKTLLFESRFESGNLRRAI